MTLIQVAVLALVALILGLFVLRPILTSAPASAAALPGGAEPLALPEPRWANLATCLRAW